jgi:hypothetical protein
MATDTQNDGEKKSVIKDKLNLIDGVISLYPRLKKDRNHIITSLLCKKDVSNSDSLIKIEYNGFVLYRDRKGNVFDEDIKLAGCYILQNQSYHYFLHKKYETHREKQVLDFKKLCAM